MSVTYDDLRQQLVKLHTELQEQLATLESEVREEGVGYSNHMADAASEVFEQARDVTLRRQIERSHEDATQALRKFDEGTYGICESCGTSIDVARLEAVPAAKYCVRCQTRFEGKR